MPGCGRIHSELGVQDTNKWLEVRVGVSTRQCGSREGSKEPRITLEGHSVSARAKGRGMEVDSQTEEQGQTHGGAKNMLPLEMTHHEFILIREQGGQESKYQLETLG